MFQRVVIMKDERLKEDDYTTDPIPPVIFALDQNGMPQYATPGQQVYAPVSQSSPPPFSTLLQVSRLVQEV